jgi:hypothetical protein
MAGEISPDMMFCGHRQKGANMGADTLLWMQTGAIGPIMTGRNTNKAKRVPNGQTGHHFERMLKCKKCDMLPKMIVTCREEQREEQRANKECALRSHMIKQRKSRKTNREAKEK